MNSKTYIQSLFRNKSITNSLGHVSDDMYQKVYSLLRSFRQDTRLLIKDLLFGITHTQSVSLLQIAHASSKKKKGGVAKNIVSSFSKFLKNSDTIESMCDSYIHKITKGLSKNDLMNVIVDGGDIMKPHSVLGETTIVRDGSSGELNEGYCVDTLVGFTKKGVTIPLLGRVFNRQNLTDTQSYMGLIQRLLSASSSSVSYRFIFDRWYDNKKLFKLIIDLKQTFLVALKGNRQVQIDGERISIKDIIASKKIKLKSSTINIKTKKLTISGKVGYAKVKVRGLDEIFSLVVCKNRKGKMLCLLTNEIFETRGEAEKQVMLYTQRWLIEENYKYMKQVYNLESINIRSIERINNIYNLLLMSIGMCMRSMSLIGQNIESLISLTRKEYYVGYQVKNLLYERIEVLVGYQNTFGVLGNFRGRKPSSKLLYQQFSLPLGAEG